MRLDDLEAANALLTVKVAAMEPRLCQCGWEGQPIIIEDGERMESSPSSYQTLPVASPNENQVSLLVRIEAMRGGQLVPAIKQDKIDELFRAIDQEREAERDSQEELSVRFPNCQCRGVVSVLNFVLISFPHIPSCITISRDPSRPSHDACPTLHPPLCFIPHDPHDPNDSYNLCLETNQSLEVYRDILECYPDHPDPS